MTDGIKVEIVSPERLVVSEIVRSASIPGTEGYFTIMAQHAPFMATLRSGFVTLVNEAAIAQVYFIRGGFAEVSSEGLTILAEEAIPYADFDHAGLQKEIEDAQAQLVAAETPEDKSYAQTLVSAVLNLAIEAGQINGTHIH